MNNNELDTFSGDVQVNSGSDGKVKAKHLNATDSVGPLERRTGKKSGERRMNEEWIHEILADQIYDSDAAFVREFMQNSETACIRACKTIIRHHPEGPGHEWLTHTLWINDKTGELLSRAGSKQAVLAEYDIAKEDVRAIEVPRKLEAIVSKARDLGYEPTIEITVKHDEQEIVWADNGIGMTAYEVDEAFNVTGNSGVRHEGDTGGNKGIGTLTFKNVTGKEGGMTVETRTRQPDTEPNVHPTDYDGIKFYGYLGGWDELDHREVPDDLRGTRFTIPVQENFSLRDFQSWVETYTSGLRVPVLYHEHRSGKAIVKEEYGDVDFIEKFNTPPIVIDQPGEFTAVAGPDMKVGHSKREDTWLVSMPIERNMGSISSFWSVAIQLHDEQGRIISGPHRGLYHNNGKVYPTPDKSEPIADLDEDDVPMPTPTGDRDRLERTNRNKRFTRHIQRRVKSLELQEVAKIAEKFETADHPADVIRGDKESWELFHKMVDYHGSYKVTSRQRNFKQFLDDRDELPDYDDDTIEKIFKLFKPVSVAPSGRNKGTRKGHRTNMMLGNLLAVESPDEIYMAASTSGAFLERKKVAEATHDSVRCIVVDSASDYGPYQAKFGFKLLKEVPRTQSDDHDYDVPASIHNSNTTVTGEPKADDEGIDVDTKQLKFRTDGDNQSIDYRKTIGDVKERLETGRTIHGKKYIVAFTRGNGPNISDHYGLADYAAITCVKQDELDALRDYDRVFTYDEFTEFADNTAIATEEGGYTVKQLVEMSSGDDGRLVIICHVRRNKYRGLVNTGANHEDTRFREFLKEDIMGQRRITDEKEPLFAVADKKTLRRAAYGFRSLSFNSNERIVGIRWNYDSPVKTQFNWHRISGSTNRYRRKAKTPVWDDESDVYGHLPKSLDTLKGQIFMGFHDKGIDPTDLSTDQIRELMNTIDLTKTDIDWSSVGGDSDD